MKHTSESTAKPRRPRPKWLAAAVLLGIAALATVLTLALRPAPTQEKVMMDAMVSRLKESGPDFKGAYALVGKASRNSQEVTDQDWDRIKQLVASENRTVASMARAALPGMAKTDKKSEVFEIVESFRNHRDLSLRQEYILYATWTRNLAGRRRPNIFSTTQTGSSGRTPKPA